MKLNVHRFGPGSPSVLLLHGLSSAGPVWWRVAGALEASGHTAIAPDLRGHGESAHPKEYSLDAYTWDVLETCPGPWDLVVGHSLGGAVAVRAASMDPDFATAYLLIDPAITFDRATAEDVHTSIVADVTNPASVDALMAEHAHWRRKDAERKRASLLATSVEVIRGTFDDNRNWSLGNQLSSIAPPVHILGAGQDALYTAEDFAVHQAGAAALTFEQVAKAGHSIHRDDPETVIQRALSMVGTDDESYPRS